MHKHVGLSSILVHLILSLVDHVGHIDVSHLFTVLANILSMIMLSSIVLLWTSQVRSAFASGSAA